MTINHKLRRINRMEEILFARKNLIKIHIFIIGCPVSALTAHHQVFRSKHLYVCPFEMYIQTAQSHEHNNLRYIFAFVSKMTSTLLHSKLEFKWIHKPHVLTTKPEALCIRSHSNEYEKRDHVLYCVSLSDQLR